MKRSKPIRISMQNYSKLVDLLKADAEVLNRMKHRMTCKQLVRRYTPQLGCEISVSSMNSAAKAAGVLSSRMRKDGSTKAQKIDSDMVHSLQATIRTLAARLSHAEDKIGVIYSKLNINEKTGQRPFPVFDETSESVR